MKWYLTVGQTFQMVARATNGILHRLIVIILLLCSSMLAQGEVQINADSGVTPISEELCNDMKLHKVLNLGSPVGCDRLRLVRFDYVGFDGQLETGGELVVMDAVADQVLQIFQTLQDRRFPIAKARLMDRYEGDDEASMADNNTSAFNVRQIAGGGATSVHAYGLAIDINPMQNPYIRRFKGTLTVSPKLATEYVDRKRPRAGMAETVVDVFAEHGFLTWGGHWRNPIDYQHFQVERNVVDQLVRLSSANAHALSEQNVERYRTCNQAGGATASAGRKSCISNRPINMPTKQSP
jgi:D-alanyl-D-alanine carboxypeptidase